MGRKGHRGPGSEGAFNKTPAGDFIFGHDDRVPCQVDFAFASTQMLQVGIQKTTNFPPAWPSGESDRWAEGARLRRLRFLLEDIRLAG
jgi:hypothetical protein